MNNHNKGHRVGLQTMIIVVVFLFALNSIVWANPELGFQRDTLQPELFFDVPFAEVLLESTAKYTIEAVKEDFENFRSKVFPCMSSNQMGQFRLVV